MLREVVVARVLRLSGFGHGSLLVAVVQKSRPAPSFFANLNDAGGNDGLVCEEQLFALAHVGKALSTAVRLDGFDALWIAHAVVSIILRGVSYSGRSYVLPVLSGLLMAPVCHTNLAGGQSKASKWNSS